MSDEVLRVEDDADGVRRVTLDRPEAANAFDQRVHDAMVTLLRSTALDPAVRAVLLTGAGAAFSVGGDLEHIERLRHDRALRAAEMQRARTYFEVFAALPQPVVAYVNGPAVGVGCTTALLCDALVMAESAYLLDPHVSLGVVAGDGAVALLPLQIGMARAKFHLLLGEPIRAADAVAYGLAVDALPAAQAELRAAELARRFARQPAEALRATKRALTMLLDGAPRLALNFAFAAEELSFDSPELEGYLKARAVGKDSADG